MGQGVNLTFHLMFVAIAVLIAGLAVPMILGKVKPNPLYGFRTRRTLSSPAVWYPANRAAGWGMLVSGAAMAIVCVIVFFVGDGILGAGRGWILSGGAFIVAMIAMLVYSFRALSKIPDAPAGEVEISEETRKRWSILVDRVANAAQGIGGITFILVSIPLIRGTVPPNPTYGFRTEKPLSDPDIWYAANEASGWDLAIAGVVILVVSLVLLFAGTRITRPGRGWLLGMGVFIVALVGALIHSVHVVGKL